MLRTLDNREYISFFEVPWHDSYGSREGTGRNAIYHYRASRFLWVCLSMKHKYLRLRIKAEFFKTLQHVFELWEREWSGIIYFAAALNRLNLWEFYSKENLYANVINVLCIRLGDPLEKKIITVDLYFDNATDPFLDWISSRFILAEDFEDLLKVQFRDDPNRNY